MVSNQNSEHPTDEARMGVARRGEAAGRGGARRGGTKAAPRGAPRAGSLVFDFQSTEDNCPGHFF